VWTILKPVTHSNHTLSWFLPCQAISEHALSAEARVLEALKQDDLELLKRIAKRIAEHNMDDDDILKDK